MANSTLRPKQRATAFYVSIGSEKTEVPARLVSTAPECPEHPVWTLFGDGMNSC
jgi:hypothetical protein